MYTHTHTYISTYVYISPSLFVAHVSSEKLALIVLAVFTYLITSSVCNPSLVAAPTCPSCRCLPQPTWALTYHRGLPIIPPLLFLPMWKSSSPQSLPVTRLLPPAGWGSCTSVDTILAHSGYHTRCWDAAMGEPSLPYWGLTSHTG